MAGHFGASRLPLRDDREERPVTAVVVAAQAKLLVTIGHSDDLSDSFAASHQATEASVDETIAPALKLHTAWVGLEVFLEAHFCDVYWLVYCSSSHIRSPVECLEFNKC